MDESQAGPAEPLLDVDDVCAWLRVARHWVYDEVEAGRLPHVRLGRRSLRFRRNDLQDYLDQRTRASNEARATPQPLYLVSYESLEPLE